MAENFGDWLAGIVGSTANRHNVAVSDFQSHPGHSWRTRTMLSRRNVLTGSMGAGLDGKWKQAWYFGDDLGLLLQLGFVDTLQA
jgi:hypothetical protein